ncbi:hypothetical protein L1987_60092 [Smallanthus sonchifolius]|uniref:Uncharacterized protein n=1 Tax=Smallanthus sonchifolius TaxID=185202 RepID=A0ACB9D7C0_9ASTR|nr:hypothetical protein L1987_60092 [Smallanthus sonchifolius]
MSPLYSTRWWSCASCDGSCDCHLKQSVLAFSENVSGTSAKEVMDMVLLTQYFDTMKDIGASSKSNVVFLPHGPGAVKDIASQTHEGLLQAETVQA